MGRNDWPAAPDDHLRPSPLQRLSRSLLATLLALAALVLANVVGSQLAAILRMPAGGAARLAWDLSWLHLACLLALWLLQGLPCFAPRGHMLAGAGAMLAVAGWMAWEMGADFPAWFVLGVLLAPPLQAMVLLSWRRPR